jgi:D-sedoheptulose 7-phosphate isomerase
MFEPKAYVDELYKQLVKTYDENFIKVLAVIKQASCEGQKILVAGNGGNSANAEHFVTDITKGLFEANGVALKATSLNSNSPRLSAIANDLPKEDTFSFQLRMLEAGNGTVVILYSAGGNSLNILKAADTARSLGSKTIGLIGGMSPILANSFDFTLWTQSDDVQIVEDVHAVFGHLVYKSLRIEP